MRIRPRALHAVPALALTLAACGGGASGPPGMAYGLPTPTSVAYVTADTMLMDIDAGGQSIQVGVRTRSTMGADFARGADGVRVTLTVRDYEARMDNPMAPASADESGISGPLVLDLDRRGRATLVSQPEVSEAAAQFFGALDLAHGFFPRLPGRAVTAGESWTDTIRYEGAQGAGTTSAVAVMTYTVAGDTVVDGRTLLKVTVQGTSESEASGQVTGMDFTQAVAGTQTGWVLWDVQRRLLVESRTVAQGDGSMNVPMAPYPMGLRVRAQSWIRLAPGS